MKNSMIIITIIVIRIITAINSSNNNNIKHINIMIITLTITSLSQHLPYSFKSYHKMSDSFSLILIDIGLQWYFMDFEIVFSLIPQKTYSYANHGAELYLPTCAWTKSPSHVGKAIPAPWFASMDGIWFTHRPAWRQRLLRALEHACARFWFCRWAFFLGHPIGRYERFPTRGYYPSDPFLAPGFSIVNPSSDQGLPPVVELEEWHLWYLYVD